MLTTRRAATATVLAGALTGGSAAVLRRMEAEYRDHDTLSPATVAAMYTAYAAHTTALVWAGRHRIGPVSLPRRPSQAAGALGVVSGVGVAVAGARPFGPSAQLSGMDAGALHTGGIYRYSRNPQYLGLGLAAAGFALATRSAFAGLVAAGVWAAYRRWIPNEERHLTRVFGDQYVGYRARVRRWLGTRDSVRQLSRGGTSPTR